MCLSVTLRGGERGGGGGGQRRYNVLVLLDKGDPGSGLINPAAYCLYVISERAFYLFNMREICQADV